MREHVYVLTYVYVCLYVCLAIRQGNTNLGIFALFMYGYALSNLCLHIFSWASSKKARGTFSPSKLFFVRSARSLLWMKWGRKAEGDNIAFQLGINDGRRRGLRERERERETVKGGEKRYHAHILLTKYLLIRCLWDTRVKDLLTSLLLVYFE